MGDTVDRLVQEENDYYRERCKQLEQVCRAMRNWIDAVPKDTVLPAMPGFDRDWADNIIDDVDA